MNTNINNYRDINGAYLAPIGSKAVLKSRSTTVTRDELFSLEESLPQASFVAALNQRYVSVKQGITTFVLIVQKQQHLDIFAIYLILSISEYFRSGCYCKSR